MAKQLRAQIDIHASPQRVWQVLTDFGAYPQWNPFMTRADGTPTKASTSPSACSRSAAAP